MINVFIVIHCGVCLVWHLSFLRTKTENTCRFARPETNGRFLMDFCSSIPTLTWKTVPQLPHANTIKPLRTLQTHSQCHEPSICVNSAYLMNKSNRKRLRIVRTPSLNSQPQSLTQSFLYHHHQHPPASAVAVHFRIYLGKPLRHAPSLVYISTSMNKLETENNFCTAASWIYIIQGPLAVSIVRFESPVHTHTHIGDRMNLNLASLVASW